MTVLRGKDALLHYSLLEGQARAVLIDSTRLCAAARRTHHLSDTATITLGRLLTGAAIMGDMLKGEGSSVTLTVKGTLQVDGTATATEDTGKIVVDETGVLVVENYDTNRDATVTVKAGGKLYVTDVSEEVPFFGTNETNASAGTELTAGSVTITFDADDNETVKFDDSSTNAVIYTWPDGWTAKNKDDNVIELGDLDAPVTITGGVVPEPDPDSEP